MGADKTRPARQPSRHRGCGRQVRVGPQRPERQVKIRHPQHQRYDQPGDVEPDAASVFLQRRRPARLAKRRPCDIGELLRKADQHQRGGQENGRECRQRVRDCKCSALHDTVLEFGAINRIAAWMKHAAEDQRLQLDEGSDDHDREQGAEPKGQSLARDELALLEGQRRRDGARKHQHRAEDGQVDRQREGAEPVDRHHRHTAQRNAQHVRRVEIADARVKEKGDHHEEQQSRKRDQQIDEQAANEKRAACQVVDHAVRGEEIRVVPEMLGLLRLLGIELAGKREGIGFLHHAGDDGSADIAAARNRGEIVEGIEDARLAISRQ